MNRKKVLIVEDELIIATHIAEILKEQNFEVIDICCTAKKALEKIIELAPDMVLLDIDLGGAKEGIAIGEFLQKKNTAPFVYITSFSDPTTLNEVKSTHPMGYIVKPFKPNDVVVAVEIAFSNYNYKESETIQNSDIATCEVPFRLKKIITYIHRNLDKKLTIETLAKMSDWKIHHFIRNFKKYLGVTPYQYILQSKVQKAMVLLTGTDLPICDIAYDLGFQSHSSFSITFFKLAKETPESFRRKRKEFFFEI